MVADGSVDLVHWAGTGGEGCMFVVGPRGVLNVCVCVCVCACVRVFVRACVRACVGGWVAGCVW